MLDDKGNIRRNDGGTLPCEELGVSSDLSEDQKVDDRQVYIRSKEKRLCKREKVSVVPWLFSFQKSAAPKRGRPAKRVLIFVFVA